jgi:hypothetical protein
MRYTPATAARETNNARAAWTTFRVNTTPKAPPRVNTANKMNKNQDTATGPNQIMSHRNGGSNGKQ